MGEVRGLSPIAGDRPRCLILGTVPGMESLARSEYYAHARNDFWPAMEAAFGVARSLPYGERCAELVRNGVALWDVLESCRREGSLDADIAEPVPNDLAGFCRSHGEIARILFNGQKARKLFDRFVSERDSRVLLPAGIDLLVLPSTSPANARRGKREVWVSAFGARGV